MCSRTRTGHRLVLLGIGASALLISWRGVPAVQVWFARRWCESVAAELDGELDRTGKYPKPEPYPGWIQRLEDEGVDPHRASFPVPGPLKDVPWWAVGLGPFSCEVSASWYAIEFVYERDGNSADGWRFDSRTRQWSSIRYIGPS